MLSDTVGAIAQQARFCICRRKAPHACAKLLQYRITGQSAQLQEVHIALRLAGANKRLFP